MNNYDINRKVTLDDFVSKITAQRAEIVFKKAGKIYYRRVDQAVGELNTNEIDEIKEMAMAQKMAMAQTNSYFARKARIAFKILKEFGAIEDFQLAEAISIIKNKK